MSQEQARKLSKELRKIATMVDDKIEDVVGERVPFTLIVYTDNRAHYVNNCGRKESIEKLKHLLESLEQGYPDIPAHKIQ